MAVTRRQVISELITDVRALSHDDRISYRYIDSKLTSKLAYFTRLEAKNRELFKDVSIWQSIDCIELEDAPVNICGHIDECNTLKRSKIKIPIAFNTNYGPLIKFFIVTGDKEIKLISSQDYKDYITREYKTNKQVCWLEGNYLYLPNTTWNAVKGLLIPQNPLEVDKANGSDVQCKSILDTELSYPDYLITLAKKEVLQELTGGYKRIVEDEKPDDNTNNKQ